MTYAKFEFSEFLSQAHDLKSRLYNKLKSSSDEKVRKLIANLPTFNIREEGDGNEESFPPLTVAFVGQYNAGKSTIISALTGLKDIPIDADVCTDKVTAYDWNGIRLLDTPGIHAGYPEHDEKTYSAIDKADLLVFVITSELFDDIVGKHFRELCFNRNKASETLLVINKMAIDPGTPDTKLPDIEQVTRPKTPADFHSTFIDALSYLEALEEKEEKDRAELMELSNFHAFIDVLNEFIRDKGLMGRLTTPLFELRAIAQQAEAFLSVDMPEERAAIELLNRKRGLLLASRSRLRGVMSGLMSAAASDLIALGDAVAEAVEPGSSEESVQAKHEYAQQQARARCEQLVADAQTAVEAELSELRRQLNALENGVLARELRSQVSTALMRAEENAEWNVMYEDQRRGVLGAPPSDIYKRFKKTGQIANNIGKYATEWATGPTEGAKIGTATAARGSEAHEVVYNVGKFFGVKFEPWGAVKVARAIGNAGRVIAAVGGVLAVVAQIAEDKQIDRYRGQLREARNHIRTAYRDSVREIERAFWTRFDDFSREFYDRELAAVDNILSELVGKRSGRDKVVQDFVEIASKATKLIEIIQSSVEV